MTISEKMPSKSIYIRFQIPANRMQSFTAMFEKATGLSFNSSLRGLSEDASIVSAILAIDIKRDANDLREVASRLNIIFVKLLDFYPTFSEKPSSVNSNTAKIYLQHVETESPISHTAALHAHV